MKIKLKFINNDRGPLSGRMRIRVRLRRKGVEDSRGGAQELEAFKNLKVSPRKQVREYPEINSG